ncbi:MAG TPA: A24 family peptidase C-terminal domain-containing protein [Methanoregula sp.]|nr:A24 family peptidase C-terminal domain-containing protein [Methanoregula sp.]
MAIFYPMVVSAIAVLVTLVYASYLDIKDRRVPFVTWYPMLAVGIPATVVLLYQQTGQNGQAPDYSIIAGYLALVASFFYANYLDTRDDEEPFRFPYLAVVLALPALSWFVLAPTLNTQLIPWYVMFAGIIGYVSYVEYKRKPEEQLRFRKKKPEPTVAETISKWYFVLIVMIFAITSVLLFYGAGGWGAPAISILLLSVFCGVFYIFGRMHLFGGADAWALIFISFCIPLFPVTPLLNYPPLGFLAFSVLINALILNLVAPIGIFVINIVRGNRAPLMYMFFGFPVPGDRIQDSWGFVMEDFEEKKGKVNRKFIGFFESIRRMLSGEGRIYTKDLRERPQEFTKELAVYKAAGTVWISYAVPFIVPITAGLITAIVFGDFLLAITSSITGGR